MGFNCANSRFAEDSQTGLPSARYTRIGRTTFSKNWQVESPHIRPSAVQRSGYGAISGIIAFNPPLATQASS